MRVILILIISVLFMRTSLAQPAGTPVVKVQDGGNTYAMSVDQNQQTLSTLALGINYQTHQLGAIQMDIDNQSILFTANSTGPALGYLGTHDPVSRVTTTLFRYRGALNDLLPSQEGGYYTHNGTTLFHMPQRGVLNVVMQSMPGTITAIGWDIVSATVLVGSANGYLWNISPQTTRYTTVQSGLGRVQSVDTIAKTGNYVVTTSASPHLRVLSRVGIQLLSFVIAGIAAAWVDQSGEAIWVAQRFRIVRFSLALAVLSSWVFPNPNLVIVGIWFYAWRNIIGNGVLQAGVPFPLTFFFPGFGGQFYFAALALAMAPGVRLQGQSVLLRPDPLFFAVIQGLFVWQFSGTLSAAGSANARFTIPRGIPVGFVIYCCVVMFGRSNTIVSAPYAMLY